MRRLRTYADGDMEAIATAWALVADARLRLRKVGARKAANYLARALKSIDGALRHALRCETAWQLRLQASVNEAERRINQ